MVGATTSTRRVLVLDDDAAVLRLLERLLSTRGYQVVTTSSVPDAVTLLDAQSYDVVLADKNLPNVSGLELARAVRAQWPTTALVLMTAHPEASVLHSTPIDGYLAKPFRHIEEVPAMLESAIERRARANQIAQMQSTLSSVKRGLEKDKAGDQR